MTPEATPGPGPWLDRALRDGLRRLLAQPEPDAAALAGEVDRLAKLKELHDLHDSLRSRRAWLGLTLLAGLAALPPVAMAVIRMPTVDVEAELRVAEVSFVTPALLRIETDVPLAAFAADGIRRVLSPALQFVPRDTQSLALQAARGAMTLQAISLPAGAQVRLSATTGRGVAVHVLCEPCDRGSIDLAARGKLQGPGGTPRVALFEASPISLLFGAPGFDITLVPSDTLEAVPLFGLVQVDSVAFLQTITVVSGTEAHDMTVSAVQHGTYRLAALGLDPVALRRFEVFALGGSRVRLHEVSSSKRELRVTLHTTASTLRTGLGGHTRDRRPTLLRWATTRQEFTLLYSTVVGVVALVLGVARWFLR